MQLWAVTCGASVEEPIQKWAADVVHKSASSTGSLLPFMAD